MFIPEAVSSVTTYGGLMLEGLVTAAEEPSKGGRSSIIGIVTSIIGNILISFALNTQRYAHIRLGRERDEQQEKRRSGGKVGGGGYGTTTQAEVAEDRTKKNLGRGADEAGEDENAPLLSGRDEESDGEEQEEELGRKSYLKSPWWWGGIALMVLGECGNFLAYGFAPASIVSPLGVVALVSNCLIAPLMLHERFRKRDGFGVIIAIGGCVTVVLSATGSDPKLDQDEILSLVTRWEFLLYMGITIALIVLLMFMSNKYGSKTILIDLGLVGLFGAYTALSTKGVASLLSNTLWRALTVPVFYVLIAILVATAIMQIRYVNKALQRFSSTQVIPVQFVLFTLSVIIGSSVLYRDFERRTASDAAEFVGGCVLTFMGVWCITSGRAEDEDNESERSPEDDEAIDLVDEERAEIEDTFDGDVRRRSSLRPPSPKRMRSTQSDTPLFQFTQYDDEPRRPSYGEASPFTEAPQTFGANIGATPAVRSAIHDDGSTISRESPQNRSKPPPMHATTSAPLLPTVHIRPERPTTPSRYTGPPSPDASRTQRPRTPDGQVLDPATSSSAPRFGSVNRSSIAGLVPGPLMNPLSHSLSAIVADSLRRGVDTIPGGGSLKRRTIRQTKSARRLPRQSSAVDGADLGVRRMASEQVGRSAGPMSPETQPQGEGSPKGRGRSVSATLGDILRPKRLKRGSVEDGEGEDGR